jgi:hypothetical protein
MFRTQIKICIQSGMEQITWHNKRTVSFVSRRVTLARFVFVLASVIKLAWECMYIYIYIYIYMKFFIYVSPVVGTEVIKSAHFSVSIPG